jgi:nicotinate-nucleotide pyrophosphorylase (carboxylating)
MMELQELLIWLAVQEDLSHGDVTTDAVVDPVIVGEASVFGREPFVLSGSRAFLRVFRFVDSEVHITGSFCDGDKVPSNVEVFRVRGNLQSILKAERTALNFLQRLCGIATLTSRMVEAMGDVPCRLLDTRKTTPLWRALEKAAVIHGGGRNHRFGLADGVLIKDNHIAACGSVREAVARARRRAPHTLRIEVEVENLDALEEALQAGADVVLLDNFSLEDLRAAVAQAAGRCMLEASGGVTIERIRDMAETGVHLISCGALTHSARAIDLTLELLPA